ncbi:Ribosome-binding ATPase YchF [uncultured archaeon]|nr:Ribosome-binding ATPase YchF [uncultured archaeon]
MLIGVVGAPNKGKSTFFSAATRVDAEIANYPFTTITPNRGITYVRSPCPHVSLGLPSCNAKNSKCANGVRLVPIGMIDVPGLVPDAHKGKGLGNKFLDSIREADALIQVVDATGKTDLQGNPSDSSPPIEEIDFLQHEIAYWLAGIMMRSKTKPSITLQELATALSGLKISSDMLQKAAEDCGLDIREGLPDEEGTVRLAEALLPRRVPTIVACNKIDVPGARLQFDKIKAVRQKDTFACSAAVELALRKASEAGLVDYYPGAKGFRIIGNPTQKQKEALEGMQKLLSENSGTGVQEAIDCAVYQHLKGIVVYPVEDEHKCTNNKGEVLPDAYLVPRGTTALQLAAMVHTDLAKKFIGAIDVKKRIRVGADHTLADGDVIKIIAGR